MTEFQEYYIDLVDESETAYGHGPIFEDLDECRLFAKSALCKFPHILYTRVISCNTGKVVDFFQRNLV